MQKWKIILTVKNDGKKYLGYSQNLRIDLPREENLAGTPSFHPEYPMPYIEILSVEKIKEVKKLNGFS